MATLGQEQVSFCKWPCLLREDLLVWKVSAYDKFQSIILFSFTMMMSAKNSLSTIDIKCFLFIHVFKAIQTKIQQVVKFWLINGSNKTERIK